MFPKWLYHATLPPTLVADPDAEAALGPGWCESPAEASAYAPPAPPLEQPAPPEPAAEDAPTPSDAKAAAKAAKAAK